MVDQHPDHDPDDLRERLRDSLRSVSPADVLATAAGLELLCRTLVVDLELTGATITLMVEAGPQGVAAASDPHIKEVDSAQFDAGEGPSRDAFAEGRPVLVYDLTRTDGRWPGFATGATARGIGAVYAFPLQVGAVRLGVLTCYSGHPRALPRQELSVCATYAEVATGYLIDQTSATAATADGLGFLADSVQIRTAVYQAQGMVMVDLGVSLAEALARLRATAFADGISLNELADDIVAGRRRLLADPAPGGGPEPPRCTPGSSDA